MNILVLTVSDQQHHKLNQYVDLHCSYDFGNWVHGFTGTGYDCCFFDFYQSFVNDGVINMEKAILQLVQEKQINIVVIPNMYYEIGVILLRKLKALQVKTIMVFFDDSSRFENTSRFYLGHCDKIVTHESSQAVNYYKNHNVEADFFPCYPSSNYIKKLGRAEPGTNDVVPDVSFVGARIADRENYVDKLLAEGIPFSVYGKAWPNGMVTQAEMINLFTNSKISLNFVKNVNMDAPKQLKARSFEIILSGGFLLTEHDDELENYFNIGEEIDTFNSVNECLEKTQFYLDNPVLRKEMQAKAYKKALNEYSFEAAWKTYLDRILCLKNANQ